MQPPRVKVSLAARLGPGMMEKTRLEMLTETLQASPQNAFIRYGLAMELKNAGRDDEAWTHFQHLLEHHPEYWAAYYQAGMLLIKLGRREEARRVMSKGLEVTGALKNTHAQSELQAALDDLAD
jgi:Flp pilus assembly protein TadD